MSSEVNRKGPIPLVHPDTQALADYLRSAQVGEVIRYDVLGKVTGGGVQHGHGAGCLQSARRILRREGIEFLTVRSEGLQRLDSEGIRKQVSHEVHLLHRATGRTLRKASNVRPEELKPAERASYFASISQLAIVREFAGAKAGKKLALAATNQQQRLSIAQSIEAFQKKD